MALNELETSLATLLRVLSDRGTVDDVARRSGYDLPPASWSLLEHLDARGALRVSDIAACHGVDISSVTPRLKRLETAGLVGRQREPGDGRAFLITITAEGVSALQSVHIARRDLLEEVVDDIDPPRLADAAEVLSHMARRLSSESTPVASCERVP